VGFPSGAHPTTIKAGEATLVASLGVAEVDMVIDLGGLIAEGGASVHADVAAVRANGPFAAPRLGDPRYRELAAPLIDAALGRSPPPPPPQPRRRGAATAAFLITTAVLAGGGGAAAWALTQPAGPPREGWQLQIRRIE
jgi:hypothetical protein